MPSSVHTGGLLSPSRELAAIKYNREQSYSHVLIKQFQETIGASSDGIVGPETVEAVARFQANNNLTVDGKIGPQTREALQRSSAPQRQLSGNQLSAHFSLSEFRSRDGAPFPSDVVVRLRELARNLEVLRAEFGGRCITVNSGYRSPAHNRRVGGASRSQHLYGRAADFNVSGISTANVRRVILRLIGAGRMKQGGLGRYRRFVHYDTRGFASRW